MNAFSFRDTAIILSMVIVYIVVTTWLTIKLRSKTNDQFMVASRALPAALVGMLLMSEFIGTPATVGTAQQAFKSGMATAWAILTASIGFMLVGIFLARRLYRSGDFTISGLIASKYGDTARLVVSLVMAYALFVVNVNNYVSGAAALSTVLKVSLPVAAVVTAVISTFYYTLGGLKGVAYVTVIHGTVKYLGVVIAAVIAYRLSGGVAPMVQNLPHQYFSWDGTIGGPTIMAWLIGNAGALFSTQMVVQAVAATKNPESARNSTFYAAALCIPIGIMAAFIGVAAKHLYPGLNSIYAFPIFIQKTNVFWGGIITTAIVASIFANVATVALAITSLLIKDFYVPYFHPGAERQLRMTRYASVVVGFLPLPFVLMVPSILKTQFFTRGLRTAITMVALAGLYFPFFSSSTGATVGLIAATVATSVWFFLGNPFGIDNIYVAVVTPILVMAIDHLLHGSGKPKPEIAVTQGQ